MDKHQSCMLFLVPSGATAVMQLYDGNCEGKLELRLVRTHRNIVRLNISLVPVMFNNLDSLKYIWVSHWAACVWIQLCKPDLRKARGRVRFSSKASLLIHTDITVGSDLV